MTANQFSFPASRTCLWDSNSLGETSELTLTKNGWLFVQISSSCLQLALNHTRSSTHKKIDCFLIATLWINEAESITLEVNRFDPGRPNKERTAIAPTSLIAGDIAMKTQVVLDSHPDSKYLPHNLTSLQETVEQMNLSLSMDHTDTPDPSHLLSLQIHCACSCDGTVTLQCGCVMPSLVYQTTPISPIPIVSTALARNLSGPLPLSALQKRIKHGYVTMEASRKLVLLMHSDPLVKSLPIIGVWVSGVGSVHHPLVWSACMTFSNSTLLGDRVWGEGGTFVNLVYCEGCTQPSYWECRLKKDPPLEGDTTTTSPFQICTGEAVMQLSSEHSLVGVALHPAQESTALHTLLETAIATTPGTSHQRALPPAANATVTPLTSRKELSVDSPLPSPPTPSQAPQRVIRDKNLSVISSLSILENSQSKGGGTEDCSQPSLLEPAGDGGSPTVLTNNYKPSVLVDAQQQTMHSTGHVMSFPSHVPTTATPSISHVSTTTTNHVSTATPPIGHVSTIANHVPTATPPIGHMPTATPPTCHLPPAITPISHLPPTTLPTSHVPAATPPTGHVISPSIHMTLENHQRQLETLQDEIKCLLQAQSPSAAMSPVTADAGTNTGASLCLPPAASSGGNSQWDDQEPAGVVADKSFSIGISANSSILSSQPDNANMHLDFHSFAYSSDPYSQSFAESQSTCISTTNMASQQHQQQQDHCCGQLSPTCASSLRHRSTEDILAEALEKVQILGNLQSSRRHSPVPGCSSLVDQPAGMEDHLLPHHLPHHQSEVRLSSCPQSIRRSSAVEGLPSSPPVDPGKRSLHSVTGRSSQCQWRGIAGGSGGSCGDDEEEEEEEEGDMTLTPPHEQEKKSFHFSTPRHNDMRPPPAVSNPPSYLQPPYVTPLSAKNGHHLLHPDVLHQQFSSDVSLLPVPHIVCPNISGDGPSFANVLGNDYTLDENVYLADMIAMKYLGLPSSRSHGSLTAASVDRTLGNISLATQQYFQRHNLTSTKRGGTLLQSGSGGSRLSNANETLDIQALKALPKLT